MSWAGKRDRRSQSSHAAAIASPPKVNGPPGDAWVLKSVSPKALTTSTRQGAHE